MKWLLVLILATQVALGAKKYELNIDECLVRTAHRIATEQIGVTEATGKNDGPKIKAYLKVTGLPEGYPYCAAGLSWSYLQAAYELDSNKSMIPFPLTAGSQKIYDHAVKYGKNVEFKPAKYDFFTWRKKDSYLGHIGMIDSVGEKGWVHTIEFNTSPGVGNQRDGDGVWRKKRNIIHPIGRLYVRGFIGFKFTSDVCYVPPVENTIAALIPITIAAPVYKPIEYVSLENTRRERELSMLEWFFMNFINFV